MVVFRTARFAQSDHNTGSFFFIDHQMALEKICPKT